MDAVAWVSLISLTGFLILIGGRAWQRNKSDFIKYGLIWLVIIVVLVIGYQALGPRFLHREEPGSLPSSQSDGIDRKQPDQGV